MADEDDAVDYYTNKPWLMLPGASDHRDSIHILHIMHIMNIKHIMHMINITLQIRMHMHIIMHILHRIMHIVHIMQRIIHIINLILHILQCIHFIHISMHTM